MANIRIDRVNAEIQKTVSEIINIELVDPIIDNEIISVVDVITSSDLSQAKIFIGILAEDKKQLEIFEALKKAKNFIKKRLGERLKLRVVPELVFIYDESMERGSKVLEILKSLDNGGKKY